MKLLRLPLRTINKLKIISMRRLIFTSALFLISFQTAFCQTDSTVLKNAVAKLQTLINTHIVEKAYLHFDKPYYVAGDTIYFKAYVTLGERHELSKLSGILHVDLIDKNDALMKSLTLKLINGLASGDFSLPDTLQKGNYRIRAYTQWMRNNGPDYFFNRYLSVGSINTLNRVSATTKSAQPALQFFPEGGNLVSDVPSKVAFKAVGANGLGINVTGVVIDNEKREVAKFAASHLGMGSFDLTPETGKTYKAKVTYANGQQSIIDLPQPDAKGIVLAINNDNPNKVSIEIRANRAYYKENLNKDLNLVIYAGGAVNTVKTKLDNEILGIDLPKTSFRTGILQVTLFSQTGEPLSERLAFIQNQDLLNLAVTSDKQVYKTEQKVHINLKNNTSANGYFSVAVVDENKVPADENTESTILSNLLLTSDLKGYVEQPNYYFANVTDDTRKNLDVLMLTQGYRRFVWKELLNNNATAAAYQPENFLDITGSLKTKTGIPLTDKNVQLLASDGSSVINQITDGEGNFKFQQLSFMDNSKFILKTETATGKNQAFLLIKNNDPQPAINNRNTDEVQYNEKADVMASVSIPQRQGMATANNSSYKGSMIANELPVGSRKEYRSSSLSGSGHADQVIPGDKILTATSLSVGLNGLLNGVDFVQGIPYLKSSRTVNTDPEPMLLIVDGTPMSEIDNIEPNSVETVELLKGVSAGIYGVRGAPGVLIITRKLSGSQTMSKEMAPGIFSIIPKGFYKAREFYSPQYDSPNVTKSGADTRTTICWKPDIITDKYGNASFEYFNADGKGQYRVVVEGIDDQGNLGRQVFRYKVE
jgi:hypothetical protein